MDTDTSAGMRLNRARTAHDRHASVVRWLWAATAYVCAAMAILGLVIPGLPTTPFVLLAAWAASRGSRRLHDWLHAHPQLGPALADWKENRAVSTVAKALAALFLVLSWLIMLWRGVSVWILVPLGVLFLCVLTFVLTRPRPNR